MRIRKGLLESPTRKNLSPLIEVLRDKQPISLTIKTQSIDSPKSEIQVLIDPQDNNMFIYSPVLADKHTTIFATNRQDTNTTLLRAQKLAFDIVREARANDVTSLDYPVVESEIHHISDKSQLAEISKRRQPSININIELAADYEDDNITHTFIHQALDGNQSINNIMLAHAIALRQNAFTLEGRSEIEPITYPRENDAWVELSPKNLALNLAEIRKFVGDDMHIIAMVKSDGYGHGAVEIARMLEKHDITYLGVAKLREALELRRAGIKTPIFIANVFRPDDAILAIENDIAFTVASEEVLKTADLAAKKLGEKAVIHVKINTGMNRGGAQPQEALRILSTLPDYSDVVFDGIYTHFATADDPNPEKFAFAKQQLAVFNETLDQMASMGIPLPRLVHTANSGAVEQFPESHQGDPYHRINGVRPGIHLYGLPAGIEDSTGFQLHPVMTVKGVLTMVYPIKKGEFIGYGNTYQATRDMMIAIVPLGYNDGWARKASNHGFALVHGQRVPDVGRISMDQHMVDVTDLENVVEGDEVVTIGTQGDEEITMLELAEIEGTIVNEAAVRFTSKRLPRFIVD